MKMCAYSDMNRMFADVFFILTGVLAVLFLMTENSISKYISGGMFLTGLYFFYLSKKKFEVIGKSKTQLPCCCEK